MAALLVIAVGAAALHLSPDGKFLYVSNRGDANDISIFAVDQTSGKLKRVGRQASLGKSQIGRAHV